MHYKVRMWATCFYCMVVEKCTNYTVGKNVIWACNECAAKNGQEVR